MKHFQSKEEWKSSEQTTWEMEETEEQKKFKQRKREKQLNEEFENMQKQLSEELQEQLEYSYQQKIEEIHRRSRQVKENYRTPGPSLIKFREHNNESRTQTEQITFWKCGKSEHQKKECWKTLFCINCGKQGHNSNKCRQTAKRGCTYCDELDHTGEYCPWR